MECNFDGNTDRLFCLGAYYFFKSSRKRSKIKELTFEDNVVEQDRLACMWEEGLTDPLAEQTRHKALTEIIGQEKAIRALRAALCGPNPQHVLIYGPPGVGKTAAARLILEEAKAREESPFRQKAKFVEIDATALQFDERNIADPLLGSVHDPIYQGGAGAFWQVGIPQPRPGAAMRKRSCGGFSRPARGRRSRRAWNFWWDRRSDNKSKKRRKCMMICRKKKDAFAGGKFHPSVFGKRRCISKRAKPILSLCDGRK